MSGLTARQEQVLTFIRECIRTNGYPPTVREICTALELSSPSTVHAHLANLERQGLIKRDPTKPRALDLVRELRPPRPLPLVGQVAAGVRCSPRRTSRSWSKCPASCVATTATSSSASPATP